MALPTADAGGETVNATEPTRTVRCKCWNLCDSQGLPMVRITDDCPLHREAIRAAMKAEQAQEKETT